MLSRGSVEFESGQHFVMLETVETTAMSSEMPWPETVKTHAQLKLSNKGRAIQVFMQNRHSPTPHENPTNIT